MTKEEQKKKIDKLLVEIEALEEERRKLKRERFRLEALYILWKASALRYQGIAAALAHAYNGVFPPDSQVYGSAVVVSHLKAKGETT